MFIWSVSGKCVRLLLVEAKIVKHTSISCNLSPNGNVYKHLLSISRSINIGTCNNKPTNKIMWHCNLFDSTIGIIIFSLISSAAAAKTSHVTCGSVLKLMNLDYRIRLHSHDVKYGTGSGQQSVTGTEIQEDVNSHWSIWVVKEKGFCERGWVILFA